MPLFLTTTVDKFLFKIAADRLYSPEGVWVFDEGGRVRLGATDYQQQLGGDVAFAHITPVGTALAVGDQVVDLETIKATVSFPSPVAGAIVEVNEMLGPTPETINDDPYGAGWFAVIEPTRWAEDRARLLDAEAYLAVMRKQAEEAMGQS